MQRVEKLPSAFRRFRKVGGAFLFIAFDKAGESDEEAVHAIGALLKGDLDAEMLRSIGYRQIDKAEFLGGHCDPQSRALVQRGNWKTANGEELIDPLLKNLEGVNIHSGGFGLPCPGEGGQFARAFAFPPYALDARPREVQSLFDEILDFLLPRGETHRILDWTGPKLGEISPWFSAGMEWWGAFLFTIHQLERGRLIALAAAATD